MDVERSYQLLVNYFAFRQNNAALFKGLNIDDHLIVDCIRDGLPMVFKNKDRLGIVCPIFYALKIFCLLKFCISETQERSKCDIFCDVPVGSY